MPKTGFGAQWLPQPCLFGDTDMMKKNFPPFGGPEVQHPDLETARIVVLPLCYEDAPSYGIGSGDGPYHLTTASEQLEFYDEEAFIEWNKLAIHTVSPMHFSENPVESVMKMKAAAGAYLSKNKFLVSIGGDHAVAIGPILAAFELYPEMGVLQVDAHLDLRDHWNGSSYNHACVMRRVLEAGVTKIVPVGTRAFCKEEADVAKHNNIKPFYAHGIDPADTTWINDVVQALPGVVYISVDLDGLDPSQVPGTGTPEPGGLLYRQLLALLKAISLQKKIVAADINELVKIEGSQVSETIAARIAQKIMVYRERTII